MMTAKGVVVVRSNPVAPDPRVQRVARALNDAGFQVMILGWDRFGELSENERLPYAIICRIVIPAKYGRGARNFLSLMRWEFVLSVWLWRHRHEYSIIHACDFDTVYPALFARWMLGKRVIYDIFDFYAEMLRSTPNFIKQFIRTLDRYAINNVNAVILADEARTKQIVKSRPKNVLIVYNTPEDRFNELFVADSIRHNEYNLHIAFVGVLFIERGLVKILHVLEKHHEWSLDLAGFGGDEEIIVRKARQLKNVSFHGRVSYEKAMELHFQADVLIATYDPSIPNHRYASPNKLFEAMMLGKPIVVAAGTNMDRIVEETGCGIVIPYGDITALEQALQRLASDPQLRDQYGAAGRKAYETRYNWELMRQKLISLYITLQ
jgi:glycosyltransferase involved in cell wall biosynthesis